LGAWVGECRSVDLGWTQPEWIGDDVDDDDDDDADDDDRRRREQ